MVVNLSVTDVSACLMIQCTEWTGKGSEYYPQSCGFQSKIKNLTCHSFLYTLTQRQRVIIFHLHCGCSVGNAFKELRKAGLHLDLKSILKYRIQWIIANLKGMSVLNVYIYISKSINEKFRLCWQNNWLTSVHFHQSSDMSWVLILKVLIEPIPVRLASVIKPDIVGFGIPSPPSSLYLLVC